VSRAQLSTSEAKWCDADPGIPLVYISFGSFLSVRADVLAKVVDALRPLPVRVALAIGSADPAVVGDVPSSWLVREFLPQVALLERAALAVTHGGNNSVTESLTCGVPMLVLPFSTFASNVSTGSCAGPRRTEPVVTSNWLPWHGHSTAVPSTASRFRSVTSGGSCCRQAVLRCGLHHWWCSLRHVRRRDATRR